MGDGMALMSKRAAKVTIVRTGRYTGHEPVLPELPEDKPVY